MSPRVFMEKNTRRRRVNKPDVIRKGWGKRNQFGGIEWLKLFSAHASNYEEWAQSQICMRAGCNDYRADNVRDGSHVMLRSFHLKRDDDTRAQDVRKLKSCLSAEPA